MDKRRTLTVRLPETLLADATELKAAPESLNDFVLAAMEREVRRRRTEAAIAGIRRVREQVFARTGPHPDPVPMIRELREGIGRRD